jgi:flagellar basal body P-ring formation protein FlgA
MISHTIRQTIATLTMLSALGGAAAAQSVPPPPALRANVTVTSDVVHIGDLVENAGPVADIPIFRSPDLGTTGVVATDHIVAAIRPHQLIGIDTRGLAEVVVTRSSRAITAQEISGRIAQALAGQYGFGDAHNILVNFDRDVRTLQVESDATGELQVLGIAYDPRAGHFDVTFGLQSSIEMHRHHPIERGQVIKASDVTVLRRPKTDGGAVTDMKAVVGLAARRQLQANQPLNAADLMKPEIVSRDHTVTIIYQAPGVTLTLRGQAQDSGALGDTISVLNIESKRVIQAVVSGPDRVTVGAITTRVVDNMVVQPQ